MEAPPRQRRWLSAIATLLATCALLVGSPLTGRAQSDGPDTTEQHPEDSRLRQLELQLDSLQRQIQEERQQRRQAAARAQARPRPGQDTRDAKGRPLTAEPVSATDHEQLADEELEPAERLAELLPPPPPIDGTWWAAPAADTKAKNAPAKPASPVADKPTYPNVKINGFFQADSVWFSQSADNRAVLGSYAPPLPAPLPPGDTPQPGDVQDGAGLRRTRLSASGAVAENVDYFVQMDFGFFGRPTFTDVWTDIKKIPYLGTVRIGQWKQPFGLEVVTSVRYQTFLERSVLFQSIAAFRHVGAGFYNQNEDQSMTWAVSVFKPGQDQFGNDLGDNGGWANAARVTGLPFFEKEGERLDYLHLGLAYWFADPSKDRYRWLTVPEAFVGEFGSSGATGHSLVGLPNTANGTPPWVDTGNLAVNNFVNFGTEALWVSGPLSFQSEMQWVHVNRKDTSANSFWGGYATISYFLTGESRPYDRKFGCLDRVKPLRPFLSDGCQITGPGAWEIAARLSHLDLMSRDVLGGRITNATFGVNWYLNGYAKLQFDAVQSFLDRPLRGTTDPLATTSTSYGIRCQVDF
jgi:phosphate-selective porin OprO and OprP